MNGEFTVTTTSQSLYDLINAAGQLTTANIPNLHGSGTIVIQNRDAANAVSWTNFGVAEAGKGIDIAAGGSVAWTNEGVTHKVIDSLKSIKIIAATANVTIGLAIV